ncbi:MAG: DNA polymerase II large subunit [Halobacteriaceae archaeon]
MAEEFEAERYFDRLESELDAAMTVAETARERGADPTDEVEIPVARDMADRVENILGIDGVADRVREMEADPDLSREEAALELVEDFVEGRVGDDPDREAKIEGAVRTAVALLTEGVVAAPIEGIDGVELRQNDDGTEFVAVDYAGPIRSAGGTAQALSVLVADYARALLDVDPYRPREEEVGRYAEEVALYDEDTGLQYSPSDAESEYIAEHCPIMLDGEATGESEVSAYRDLERVHTNRPRGGLCLVLAEGIALKAPKIKRYTDDLEAVDWPWLDALIEGTVGKEGGEADDDEAAEESGDAGDESDASDGLPAPDPSSKYLRDLIAGRPVFGHPSRPGGFRLRYGRARNHGFATAGVHPATMHLVEDFLAPGTQLKTERPGKAAGVVPVDSIEGPTVRLATGEVTRIDDPDRARELRNGVVEILDLGEYLVNYGEFVENNHPLAPAAYTVEWWSQDLAAAGADVQALRDSPYVDIDDPDADQALAWATDHDAPLHPAYTYLWHDVDPEDVTALAAAVADGRIETADGGTATPQTDETGEAGAGSRSDGTADRSQTAGGADPGGDGETADGVLVLERRDDLETVLETLLVEHTRTEASLRIPDWVPLARSLGVTRDLDREATEPPADAATGLDVVEAFAPFAVQARAPTRIGCRMGRPEKSEARELSPAVHALFPIGDAGGNQRDVGEAARHRADPGDEAGVVEVEVGQRRCPDCDTHTYRARCPDCGARTDPHYACGECGTTVDETVEDPTCPRCDRAVDSVTTRRLDLGAAYDDAIDAVGEREGAFDVLKGVKGLTSATKTPEPLEKGVLRAVHDVTAFKDGTVRYDMTDLPVTAIRPAEVGGTADRFRDLGYETDVHGDPLEHDDQLVELAVQDVVLAADAADYLVRTADFVDDLLTEYYDLDPYYEVSGREDLIGELVFGLAPHTSAAVLGRIVGFSGAAAGYAHPYFHAAKRRNCLHPESRVWVAADGDWHYEPVADVVEARLDAGDPRELDDGSVVAEVGGDLTVPSVTSDGEPVRRDVEAVSRHPAPDHLLAVETAAGRELLVTPDHSMRRWAGDGVEAVPATDLAAGDRLPAYDGGVTTGGDVPVALDAVASVDPMPADVDHVYCLTVADTHAFVADDLYVGNCDGDEDCVMLVMDGLLNFSKSFLPDRRGGQMDAPLVMTSRIDPAEIDDEAHNVDVVDSYPRSFYEASRRMADPDEVDVELAADSLGTESALSGFGFTHDVSDIAAGPALSAYKTLGSMEEKMDDQLELARRLRAVDEGDVAERIIEGHFLPDLLGNLRAFTSQEVRCLDCGTSFRRPPLTGDCRDCGGDVTLTVHEGSVTKYMDTALAVAEEYGARQYTVQRLRMLERRLDRLFEDDTNRPTTIGDFM